MYNYGRMYGNRSEGYAYSPDRSRDVDRFNPSTRANYSYEYNTRGGGVYNPTYSTEKRGGYYDGRGVYHAE